MRKKLFALVMAGIMASSLAGCGETATTPSGDAASSTASAVSATTAAPAEAATTEATGEAKSTDATASGDKVVVSVLCAYASEDPHGKYVYQYAKAYEETHPNVQIDITAISSNDILTKLSAMATNTDDLPTLFWTSGDMAPSENDLGLMEDIGSYIDDDTKAGFANGVVDGCTLDNKMVIYPIDVQPSAVIYRKDRFEEAGLSVPTTWEDFLKCAQALTKDSDGDGQIDQWGFSMVGSNNSSGQSRFMAYLWSNGLDILTDDGGEWKAKLDGDDFLKAFTFWTDMNNKYQVVPTGITEVDYATAANYFAMGYTSMILSGSNALGVAYDSNPDLKGKLGSFVIPGGNPGTMLNAEGYGLCKYATDEEKAAAIDYLKFFSSNDSDMMFWQSSGKIPATLDGQKADYISGDDYKGYLDTIAQGCRPVLNFAGMGGLKTALGDAYSSVFSGEKTNEEAVKQLQSDVDTLLEDYN